MRVPTSDFGGVVVGPPLHLQETWLQWFLRSLRETANPNTMHTEDLTPVELERIASFESLDYYKPYPDMYVEYLRESHKNRQQQYIEHSSSSVDGTSPVTSEAGVSQSSPAQLSTATTAAAASSGAERAGGDGAPSLAGILPNPSASPIQHVSEAFPMLQMDKVERHAALRWLLHVVIALSVGIVATFVSYAVDFVESSRAEALYRVMKPAGPPHSRLARNFVGFCYTVAGSVVLAAVASGVVVYFEPAASGGGIPDVMAYLNGVHLRKAMNLRTFAAKIVSCICAVASGLPVGLEAPLIHLGAITGAGVTQGRSRTLGFQTALFQAFRNNKDRRDFITAGAACGVSVAFGAPIGGLLFVMEEVSSFWDQSSNGQIFLATMLCFTFSTIINSIVEDRRLLGWVSNAASVLFEVNLTIPLNLVSIVPSLLLGLIIGSIAALFTKINLMMMKWRRRVLRPYRLRRFLEPVVVGAVFSACTFCLTLVAPCAPEHEIADVNATVHLWGTEGAGRLFNNTCTQPNTYSPLGTLNMASGKNTIRHLFSRQTAGEFTVVNLVLYFFIYFAFAIMSSGMAVAGGLVVPSLVMGAVFGRLFGLVFFKLGITPIPDLDRGYAAADAWMDPGVFALIGAGAFLAGTSRMTMAICVIMVELSAELHYLLPVMVAIVMSKSTADWLCEPLYHQMLVMDSVPYLPQNIVKAEFEQLTAADVMASDVVTLRMQERTEVVLAALRDSTHHAFPVVEAELGHETASERVEEAGKGTAAAGGGGGGVHGGPGRSINSSGNRDTAGSFAQMFGSAARQNAIQWQQQQREKSGANVAPHVHYKFVGLVTREDLQVYFTLPQLQEYDAASASPSPSSPPVPLTAKDSDGFGGRLAPCVLAIRELTWQQWMTQKSKLFFATSDRYEWVRTHIPDGAPSGVDVGDGTASFISENRLPPVIDLSLIVNRSPWVIPPFFNLQMAYQTFRMMGLRHMVVVDGDTVTGMITRKDLLVDSLRRRMKELSARLATADSAAPSLPPSHTRRTPLPVDARQQQQHQQQQQAGQQWDADDDDQGPVIRIFGGEGTLLRDAAAAQHRFDRPAAHPRTTASAWARLEQEAASSAAATPHDRSAEHQRSPRGEVAVTMARDGPPSDSGVASQHMPQSASLSTLFAAPPAAAAAVDEGKAAPRPVPPTAVVEFVLSNSLPDSPPPSLSHPAAVAGRPLPPEAEKLFDLSVVRSPRDL